MEFCFLFRILREQIPRKSHRVGGRFVSGEKQRQRFVAHLFVRHRAARFFDLPDYLTYRATGSDVRSLCSTTCKWTYLGAHGTAPGWQSDFFHEVGLGALKRDRTVGAFVYYDELYFRFREVRLEN